MQCKFENLQENGSHSCTSLAETGLNGKLYVTILMRPLPWAVRGGYRKRILHTSLDGLVTRSIPHGRVTGAASTDPPFSSHRPGWLKGQVA